MDGNISDYLEHLSYLEIKAIKLPEIYFYLVNIIFQSFESPTRSVYYSRLVFNTSFFSMCIVNHLQVLTLDRCKSDTTVSQG